MYTHIWKCAFFLLFSSSPLIHFSSFPLLQVATDARWGRGQEAFGEDPHLVTALGLAALEGFQGGSGSTNGSANGSATGRYIPDFQNPAGTKLVMQGKHYAMYVEGGTGREESNPHTKSVCLCVVCCALCVVCCVMCGMCSTGTV